MRTLFYSTRDFERPYPEAAGGRDKDASFIRESLSIKTVSKARGFDIISIFTVNDIKT